jgi:ABC-type nickel/cobalt efflux system permease component RcnA
MGNFSINHYASLHVEHGSLLLRYRIDLAEIATAQEYASLDADGDGTISEAERSAFLAAKTRQLTGSLDVHIDDAAVLLSPLSSDLQIRPGAADLPTLLLTIDYRIPLTQRPAPAGTRFVLQYQDRNYTERAGWREITCSEGPGCRIVKANVPHGERSAGLTAYPANPTEAPPQELEAQLAVVLTEAVDARPSNPTISAQTGGQPAPPSRNTATPQDRFTSLITTKQLSPGVLAFSLGVAFALGSFHALSPGHGKTVVAAYLVGSRGTPRHALLLGAVVTVTHVIGVVALGVVVLAASNYVVPDRLYPWLGYASGLLIIAIGIWQFGRRYAAAWLRARYPDGTIAAVAPGGHHHGPGGHSHELPDRITASGLIALGISGGILPCPSALIVMLSAIALHRAALGLVLICSFSVGLASVLIAIGLLMLYARQLMQRLKWEGGLLSRLPLVSPLFVAALGVVISVQSLTAAGVLSVPHAATPAAVAASK